MNIESDSDTEFIDFAAVTKNAVLQVVGGKPQNVVVTILTQLPDRRPTLRSKVRIAEATVPA